jgi:uncharacterized damage-inducible protein DinB
MSGSVETLKGIYGMTDMLMPLVLGDLSDEDARRRSRGEQGPSISWSVGHLLCMRVYVLNTLGVERDNPYEEAFGTGAATDGADYPRVAELREAWNSLSEAMNTAFDAGTEETLDSVLTDGWYEGQRARDRLVFLGWHEGYHFGVIGAIRKDLGYPGPAELMMRQREEGQG